MWAHAPPMPRLGLWAPHLSVVLAMICFAQAAVINPQGKKNETDSLPEQPEVGYPGVNSVAPGPLAQCNNYYADVVFVVDSTATYMNDDYWKKVKEFLAEVAIVLGAGLDDRIRLGMVVYGKNYSQVFSLNNFTESMEIAQAIRNAARESNNDTSSGITPVLHGLHDGLFSYDNGARMFLPHQAVIFTTPILKNEAAEEEIIKEIAMVHDAGIETYSIAVEYEEDFEDTAKLLASPPRQAGKNYWYLSHYGNLDMSLVTDLAAELCTYNRDTSITFSRSYAPANGRGYNEEQNFDQDQFRAAQPNDEEYDRRQQNNFGGPPVIRNDNNYEDQRNDQNQHGGDRQEFNEPPPREEQPPPRQERPPYRPSNRPRGPGPRIGSSYQGPPPRKDGGGNGPPPPGGQGPGGGQPEGQNIRAGGVGASGGRAPQTNSGYVPLGGHAFGGHDGFRGPNRSPQGIPLRGLNGYGYGGHDGFVGYGAHAFGYGSAGVRGPVFGPRAPVYRASKTRNPAPRRGEGENLEDERQRRPPPEDSRERQRGPPEDSRERQRGPPEDSREKYDGDSREQRHYRPPPNKQQFRRPPPPPPRDDHNNFRSASPQHENDFRQPPNNQENFRPPSHQNNFRNEENNNRFDRPFKPQEFRPNQHDDSQHQGGFQNRPPPREDFNRPPPPQQNFRENRPPHNQFQNQQAPNELPRGRFQDNRPRRPEGDFRNQQNSQHDNNRARDESPIDDEHSSSPNHQQNFEPPPPPVSFVRPIVGFNSPVNPHISYSRHPNDAGYEQGPHDRSPQNNANDRYHDDGAGDGQSQGHYQGNNQGHGQERRQPPHYQPQERQFRQEPGPQFTQAGQVGRGPGDHHEYQSYGNKGKDEFQKAHSYGKDYQQRGKYDRSYGDQEAEYPNEKIRYSEQHGERNHENFKGYDKYYGFEDHVRERGEDVGRFVDEAAKEYNNDHHQADDHRNYDVPHESKEYQAESQAPALPYKSSEDRNQTDAKDKAEESEGVKQLFGKVLSPYNEGYKKALGVSETKEKQYEQRELRPTIERVGQPLVFYDPRKEVYPPPPPPPGHFAFRGEPVPRQLSPEENIYGSREGGVGPRDTNYGSREGGINAPRQIPVYGSREVGDNRQNPQVVYGNRDVDRLRGEVDRRNQYEQSEFRPPPYNQYREEQSVRRPFYPYQQHSGDPRRPVEIYRFVPFNGRAPASYETLRNQPSYYGNPEIQGRLISPGIPVYKAQYRPREEGYKDLKVDHIAKDIPGGEVALKGASETEVPKPDQATNEQKPQTEQRDVPRAARLSAAAPPLDDESAEGFSGSTIAIATVAGVLGAVFLSTIVAMTTRTIQKRKKQREAERFATASRINRFIPPNHLPFNSMSSKFSTIDLDNDDDTISTISSVYSVVNGHSKSA